MYSLRKMFCCMGCAAAMFAMGGMNVSAKTIEADPNNLGAAFTEAANDGEASIINIPGGSYTIADELVLSSDLTVNGNGATFTRAGGAILKLENCTNVEVKDLIFSEGSTPFYSNGNNLNAKFNNCKMANATFTINDNNMSFVNCTDIRNVLVYRTGFCMDGCTVSGSVNAPGVRITSNSGEAAIINSTFLNTGGPAVESDNAGNLTITGNRITNAAYSGLFFKGMSNSVIKDNVITDSAFTGLQIVGDTNSVIEGNTIEGSACTQAGEGLVVESANGTRVVGNKVNNTRHITNDTGNGIIIARSSNCFVERNTVSNSANHGIQVSYSSQNISVSNNNVSASNGMGISISRGSNANVSNNEVTTSAKNGIVYDGHEGRCSGNITDNTVISNGVSGVWCTMSDVTIQDNIIKNNPVCGIELLTTTTASVIGNSISKDAPTANEDSGIMLYNDVTANLEDNSIGNYYRCGISANSGSAGLTGKNNTVTVNNTNGFTYIAMATSNNKYIEEDNAYEVTIGNSSAYAECDRVGKRAGVVASGVRYETRTTPVDYYASFRINYPAQPSTDNIVLYFVDDNDNAFCFNAPVGFTLDNLGNIQGPVDKEAVKALVTRMYNESLDRDPDAGGLDYWVSRLAKGKTTGTAMAVGFIFSPEFKAKNYCNEDYIKALYKAFMGRSFDQGGLDFWIEQMNNGATREKVFNSFCHSEEFETLCANSGILVGPAIDEPKYGTVPTGPCIVDGKEDGVTGFVKRLYSVCLGRDADPDGLKFWTNELWSHSRTGADAARGYIFSEEFISKNYDNNTYIEYLYRAFMGREADPAGRDFWVSSMTQSGKSREDVFEDFVFSDEFTRICNSYGIVRN